MTEINWDCEFGGSLVKAKKDAPQSTIDYLDDNGTRIEAYDAWFVEGFAEYYQPENIVETTIEIGPMRAPSLCGLTQEQLTQVVIEGYMGHPWPEVANVGNKEGTR